MAWKLLIHPSKYNWPKYRRAMCLPNYYKLFPPSDREQLLKELQENILPADFKTLNEENDK